MQGMEPRIREQIRFHVEGDLDSVVVMAEKAHVWGFQGKEDRNVQNKEKSGRTGSGKQGQQNFKLNKKLGSG